MNELNTCVVGNCFLNAAMFQRLDAILGMDAPLAEQLVAAAEVLRGRHCQQMPLYYAEEVERAAEALDRMAQGDPGGLAAQLRSMVELPEAQADRVHFAFNIVGTADGLRAGFLNYRLHRRTMEAQKVTRSPDFVALMARRLGCADYPPVVLDGRIQGVETLETSGFIRYSWFSDFLPGVKSETAATDGGVLFSNFPDDLLGADRPVLEALFPGLYREAEARGLLTIETTRFASNMYFSIHDCLGHLLPFPMNHPTREQVGFFLRGGLEELLADLHPLWAAVAPETRPFMETLFSPEDLAFFPIIIILKRVGSYLPRGHEKDADSGDLMIDHDARAALLLYRALEVHGVITPSEAGLDFHAECLPKAINALLDECLTVERCLARGDEAYSQALASFNSRYAEFDEEGNWLFPASVRDRLARAKHIVAL